MKDFLKFTFATVTGLLITGIVFFLISIVTIIGMLSGSDTETVVRKKSVMMLDLNGQLQERAIENPLELFFGNNSYSTYGLDDILSSIKKLKNMITLKAFTYKPITYQLHSLHCKKLEMP